MEDGAQVVFTNDQWCVVKKGNYHYVLFTGFRGGVFKSRYTYPTPGWRNRQIRWKDLPQDVAKEMILWRLGSGGCYPPEFSPSKHDPLVVQVKLREQTKLSCIHSR